MVDPLRIVSYNGVMTDNQFIELIESQVGPAEPISPQALARINEDALLNQQIVALARTGVPYPLLAEQVGMSLPSLLSRINQIISTENETLSKGQMNDYLLYQLQLIQHGVNNALEDMAVEPTGDDGRDKLIYNARDKGRVALHKFLQHQAAIMQLFRQQIDIREFKKVEITVLTPDDWEAL